MVKFREIDHKYESIVPDNRVWRGVTTALKSWKEQFPANKTQECSVNPNSPWFAIEPNEIQRIWDEERNRSTKLGKWYHELREKELCCKNMSPVVDGWKYALPQQLENGVYPEMIVYHPEYNICGQSDRVECVDNVINVGDYKTSKVVKTRGFKGKKMLKELSHLEDCELTSYTLQLSIYLRILLYHNPHMRPGKLTIEHVKFKINKYDRWGYPIHQKTKDGGFIVEDITYIDCAYLEKEAEIIMKNAR